MEYESWEDSDPDFRTSTPDPELRSSTPVFTSDDEFYPTTVPSPNSKKLLASRGIMTVPIQRNNFTVNGLLLSSRKVKNFGQRKQRRFENDFVFWNGMTPATLGSDWMTSNPTMMALCAQLEALEIEQKIVQETIFQSFKKANPGLFEAFIEGEDVVFLQARQRKATAAPLLLTNEAQSTKMKEERIEISLGRIDRKVRQHLVRAADFVQDLEAILLGDDEFSPELEEQVRVERGDGKDEWVVFITLESPFHRMLAHGVAQFYNIPSKSTRANSKSPAKTVKFNVNRSRKPGRKLSSYLKEKRNNQ